MNITVKIDAQEVAQAIHALAQAINNNLSSSFKALADAQQEAQTQQQQTQQQQTQQQQTQQPVQVPTQQPVQQQPAPTQQQVPTQQPAQQVQPAQPVQQQQVPTQQAQTYTIDELGKASALLMDAGKQQDLVNLLGQFGVQALTQLPESQYGAFATALRGLGAQI